MRSNRCPLNYRLFMAALPIAALVAGCGVVQAKPQHIAAVTPATAIVPSVTTGPADSSSSNVTFPYGTTIISASTSLDASSASLRSNGHETESILIIEEWSTQPDRVTAMLKLPQQSDGNLAAIARVTTDRRTAVLPPNLSAAAFSGTLTLEYCLNMTGARDVSSRCPIGQKHDVHSTLKATGPLTKATLSNSSSAADGERQYRGRLARGQLCIDHVCRTDGYGTIDASKWLRNS